MKGWPRRHDEFRVQASVFDLALPNEPKQPDQSKPDPLDEKLLRRLSLSALRTLLLSLRWTRLLVGRALQLLRPRLLPADLLLLRGLGPSGLLSHHLLLLLLGSCLRFTRLLSRPRRCHAVLLIHQSALLLLLTRLRLLPCSVLSALGSSLLSHLSRLACSLLLLN